MQSARLLSSIAILGATAILLAATARAQDSTPSESPSSAAPDSRAAALQASPPASPPITSEIVRERLQEAQDSMLEEAVKEPVVEAYEQALAELEAAAEWSAKRSVFDKGSREAAAEVEQLTAEVADEPTLPQVGLPDRPSLEQLQGILEAKKGERDLARQALEELQAQIRANAESREDIPKQLPKLRERLAEIDRQLKAPPPQEQAVELTQAQRTRLEAQMQSLAAQIAALEEQQEYLTKEAVQKTFSLREKLYQIRLARTTAAVENLQPIVENRRQLERRRLVQQTRREAARAHPVVKPILEQNAELAVEGQQRQSEIKAAANDLEKLRTTLEEVEKEYERTTLKVDEVGLTDAIGLLLRKQRAELPEHRQVAGAVDPSEEVMRDTQLRLLELRERADDLASVDDEVDAIMAELPSTTEASAKEIAAALRESLRSQREILDTLINDYDAYFSALEDLDTNVQELNELLGKYEQFIDEWILYIQSSKPLSLRDAPEVARELAWLFSAKNWETAGMALWRDLKRSPAKNGAPLLVVVLLLGYGVRLRRLVDEAGRTLQRNPATRISKTFSALSATLLASSSWAVLLALIGWMLRRAAGDDIFLRSAGGGFLAAAMVYFPLEALRQLCRQRGVADAHFLWPQNALAYVRRRLRWLTLAAIPLVFTIAATEIHGGHARDDALGRLAHIAWMTAVAVFAWRLLAWDGGFMQAMRNGERTSWLVKTRYLVRLVAIGAPLALAGLDATGYYYTSFQLSAKLHVTFWLALLLMTLMGLAQRWLVVARIRLAREQAQARAEARTDLSERSQSASEVVSDVLEQPQADARALSEQTKKLLHGSVLVAAIIGLWVIWVDVLPALGMLRHQEVWSTTVSTVEIVTDAEGVESVKTVEKLGSVTLADIGLALLVLGLAAIATWNLPGLLELTILQRLPIDAGARFAITTVSRYLAVIAGVLIAAGLVHLQWSKVQWLAAAMTVGLGFGLQEIFANFVSGLILLGERPIRVGDIVTVEGVTGVVSRIRMRATTITNWDRQEYVIPNKDFITGRVLNWTLSNATNRVVVNVGVAYGSDTKLAHRLLLEICQEQPLVMDDPAPIATFEAFGDSTLNFVLRCYLPNLDNRLDVIHELHTRIDERFREHGIEIAFPQRDLHIRSIQAPLALQSDGAATELKGRPAPTSKESAEIAPAAAGNGGRGEHRRTKLEKGV